MLNLYRSQKYLNGMVKVRHGNRNVWKWLLTYVKSTTPLECRFITLSVKRTKEDDKKTKINLHDKIWSASQCGRTCNKDSYGVSQILKEFTTSSNAYIYIYINDSECG